MSGRCGAIRPGAAAAPMRSGVTWGEPSARWVISSGQRKTSERSSRVSTSSGGPSAAARPASSSRTRSAKRAAKLSSCVTSSAASPVSASSAMSSKSSMACRTSSDAVGSSRTSARGSCARARATRTRCHSPPDSSSTRLPARCAASHRSSAAATACRSSSPTGDSGPSRAYRPSRTVSSTRRGKTVSSRWVTTPTTRASSDRVHAATARPSTEADPAASGTSPRSPRSNVVLPLPFGPVTATSSPGATSTDTRSSAGTVALP